MRFEGAWRLDAWRAGGCAGYLGARGQDGALHAHHSGAQVLPRLVQPDGEPRPGGEAIHRGTGLAGGAGTGRGIDLGIAVTAVRRCLIQAAGSGPTRSIRRARTTPEARSRLRRPPARSPGSPGGRSRSRAWRSGRTPSRSRPPAAQPGRSSRPGPDDRPSRAADPGPTIAPAELRSNAISSAASRPAVLT